jgi:hypothetical protein
MTHRIRDLRAIAVAVMVFDAGVAGAATPVVLWQQAGLPFGVTGSRAATFSDDGSALLLRTTSGFELHQSSSGALLKTLTLPAASLSYDASAFSRDKTLDALALHNGAGKIIELWRLSDNTLARTIATDFNNSSMISFLIAGPLSCAMQCLSFRRPYTNLSRTQIF